MVVGRRTWNAWDVPYFGTRGAGSPPDRDPPEPRFLPLAADAARPARKVWAVVFAVGSVVAGVGVTGLLLAVSLVLGFGSPPDGADLLVACSLGGLVAGAGVVVAVLSYRAAGHPIGVIVHDDRLEISYPSFREPLVVLRSGVRAVAIDGGSGRFDRERFRVEGFVPADRFADALDNLPAGPWEDLDPERHRRGDPWPGVIVERPRGYAHDDPGSAGWASAGNGAPASLGRPATLWSAHGSSLPFLRVGLAELPDVAMLFQDSIQVPRARWWLEISPVFSRCGLFRGGRAVRGFLLNARSHSAFGEALDAWGVVRPITVEDVVGEGLLVAKPLMGWRALAYAVVILGSLAADLLIRSLR